MKLAAMAAAILAIGIVVGFAPLTPAQPKRMIGATGARAKRLYMQDTGSDSKHCLDCGEPLSEQVMAARLVRCTPCSAEHLRSAQG